MADLDDLDAGRVERVHDAADLGLGELVGHRVRAVAQGRVGDPQIALAASSPGRLPIEFQLTSSRPQPWTPEVVIGRMAGYVMTRNARTEVRRHEAAAGMIFGKPG